MKKLLLFTVVAVLGFTNVNAQEAKFGVKAGVDFASLKAKGGGANVSVSETGFYIGGLVEVAISDSFIFQPEVLYVSIEDLDMISIPLMAKFPVSEEFNVLAGPSLGLMLDSEPGQKSFNYGIEAGAAYDINEEFFIEVRYSLGLANLLEDAPSGVSVKLNGAFLGLGYRF